MLHISKSFPFKTIIINAYFCAFHPILTSLIGIGIGRKQLPVGPVNSIKSHRSSIGTSWKGSATGTKASGEQCKCCARTTSQTAGSYRVVEIFPGIWMVTVSKRICRRWEWTASLRGSTIYKNINVSRIRSRISQSTSSSVVDIYPTSVCLINHVTIRQRQIVQWSSWIETRESVYNRVIVGNTGRSGASGNMCSKGVTNDPDTGLWNIYIHT